MTHLTRVGAALGAGLLAVAATGVAATAATKTITWATCCAQTDRWDLFQKIAKEYEALHPDVKINWVYPSGGNYYSILETWIAGGKPADVMWLGSGFWQLVNGQLLPLDDLVASDNNIKSINATMLATYRWKGVQLALPYGANTHTMAYNKDMLAAAGIADPTAAWTWDQAIAMAKKLTKDTSGDGTPEQFGLSIDELTHSLNYGGDFFNADGTQAQFANPTSIKAAQLYADVVSGKLGVYPAASLKLGKNQNQFANGKTAMVNIGIFSVPFLRQNAKADWGVVTLPGLESDGEMHHATFNSAETWAIYKNTQYPDVARDFVRFLFQPKIMDQIAGLGVVIPTQPEVGVRYFLSQSGPPDNLRAFVDALEQSHQMYYATTLSSKVTPALLGDTWKQLFAGKTPASIALPEIQRQINAILATGE